MFWRNPFTLVTLLVSTLSILTIAMSVMLGIILWRREVSDSKMVIQLAKPAILFTAVLVGTSATMLYITRLLVTSAYAQQILVNFGTEILGVAMLFILLEVIWASFKAPHYDNEVINEVQKLHEDIRQLTEAMHKLEQYQASIRDTRH